MKRFYLNHNVFTTGFCFELMEGRITLHIYDMTWLNIMLVVSAPPGILMKLFVFFVYLFSSLLKEVKM